MSKLALIIYNKLYRSGNRKGALPYLCIVCGGVCVCVCKVRVRWGGGGGGGRVGGRCTCQN